MKRNSAGYTIVELLIVLAVTAAIGLAAFAAISGQRGRNEFRQAARDFDSKLMDVANDVGTGYFPNYSGRRCRYIGNTLHIVPSPPPPAAQAEQGSSNNCVFIGKAIQFNPTNRMQVYTLAGKRDATNIQEAEPEPMTTTTSLDLTETHDLLYGMSVRKITPAAGAIIFLTSFGGLSSPNPVTNLYYLSSPNFLTAPLSAIESGLKTAGNYTEAPPSGITICLEGNGTYAKLVLGSANQKLTTETTIGLSSTEAAAIC